MSCTICGGLYDTEEGFPRVHLFFLPILIPPTTPQSLIVLSLTLYTASLNKKLRDRIILNIDLQHFCDINFILNFIKIAY
jgi:hypothetical protein